MSTKSRPRWLTSSEERAWRAYRRMKAVVDLQVYRDLAAESGLSEPDYDVLSALTEVPTRSWRANELADRLLWSSSRLSHQVRRMEERGLVRREGFEDDKRGALIVLTRRGMQNIKAAAPGHVESVRRNFVDLLSRDELAALSEMSEKVLRHIEGRERL